MPIPGEKTADVIFFLLFEKKFITCSLCTSGDNKGKDKVSKDG